MRWNMPIQEENKRDMYHYRHRSGKCFDFLVSGLNYKFYTIGRSILKGDIWDPI